MKHRYLASTLSIIAMLASGTWNSASAVTFNPPTKNPAPSQATGGASRGTLFTPAVGKNAPSQATGGASRGTLFAPVAGRQAPNQATGGASRGTLFAPVAGRQAPNQAAGGASRGNIFAPVAGRQTPNQAAGGASRAGIYYLNNSTVSTGPAALIALLPQNFYGTTVAERPTILVYLPDSNAEEAVFSLKDEAGNMQYQMTIPVAEKSGVVAIKLPADAPALAVGQKLQLVFGLKNQRHSQS
ncbi:hypothetical protein B6N60_04654 [Richelia sinica FACHB-800]|uniref:Uncharacterized protein n=1 Tax=Richelia sinica FACHB-800 TaxID=1357546 RepID=A0A975Y745_9NOST|nr:hypothetical protein B6N60_04654 [Richelia sinica FACHB-800]